MIGVCWRINWICPCAGAKLSWTIGLLIARMCIRFTRYLCVFYRMHKSVTRQLTANASFSVSLPSSRLQCKANFMQKNFVFPPINFQLNCHWTEVVHADFPYRYNSLEATTIHATNINNWAIAFCNNKKQNIYELNGISSFEMEMMMSQQRAT